MALSAGDRLGPFPGDRPRAILIEDPNGLAYELIEARE